MSVVFLFREVNSDPNFLSCSPMAQLVFLRLLPELNAEGHLRAAKVLSREENVSRRLQLPVDAVREALAELARLGLLTLEDPAGLCVPRFRARQEAGARAFLASRPLSPAPTGDASASPHETDEGRAARLAPRPGESKADRQRRLASERQRRRRAPAASVPAPETTPRRVGQSTPDPTVSVDVGSTEPVTLSRRDVTERDRDVTERDRDVTERDSVTGGSGDVTARVVNSEGSSTSEQQASKQASRTDACLLAVVNHTTLSELVRNQSETTSGDVVVAPSAREEPVTLGVTERDSGAAHDSVDKGRIPPTVRCGTVERLQAGRSAEAILGEILRGSGQRFSTFCDPARQRDLSAFDAELDREGLPSTRWTILGEFMAANGLGWLKSDKIRRSGGVAMPDMRFLISVHHDEVTGRRVADTSHLRYHLHDALRWHAEGRKKIVHGNGRGGGEAPPAPRAVLVATQEALLAAGAKKIGRGVVATGEQGVELMLERRRKMANG